MSDDAPDYVEPTPSIYIKIGATEYDAADYSVPAERTFRDAWEASGDAISVNMDAAKDLWRDKVRRARKPLLEALDADFMRALETGASTTQIATDKQALRDAPAHADIASATTPDELKAAQPISGVTIT